MRSPLWHKLLLVLTAYAPLFLILFVKLFNFENLYYTAKYFRVLGFKYLFNFNDFNDWLAISSLFLLLISIFSIIYIKLEVKQTLNQELARIDVKINKINSRDKDVLVYLMTYVLPLVSLNTNNIKDGIIFLILISLILWLSVYSEILYINPALFILGERLYEIETNNGKQLLIVNKRHIQNITVGKKLICFRIDEDKILVSKGRFYND